MATVVNEREREGSALKGNLAMALFRVLMTDLILHGHGVRVHSLLPGNSLKPGQNSAIVVLIALHRKAALLVTIGLSQTDVVLL